MEVQKLIIADHFFTRLRGLLFRRPLTAGEGLILIPCSSIHTVGMAYAIDVVFLDAECRILRVVRSLPPGKAKAASGAKMVLELADGGAVDMKEGDQLSWLQTLLKTRQ